jgi:hypothetical protein
MKAANLTTGAIRTKFRPTETMTQAETMIPETVTPTETRQGQSATPAAMAGTRTLHGINHGQVIITSLMMR